MEQKAQRFLTKANLKPENILYFIKIDRKTVLYLADGRQLETYLPVKYLLSALPKDAFLNITKGVVISAAAIRQIDGHVYTMLDGRQFTGRRRGTGEHKTNRHRLENQAPAAVPLVPQTIAERFSVLDHSPLACCVIQIILDKSAHRADYIFRYCNRAMLELEGCKEEDLLNRSFYHLPKNWDHRWLAIYTDVALNGTQRVITDHDPQTGRTVTLYCYQPMEEYCVCVLIQGEVHPLPVY